MSDKVNTVNVSTITLLKVVLIGLLIWFLFVIREVIVLFLISLIISSAIDPLADYLAKKKFPRALSVLIIYILFLGIVGLAISLLVPVIIDQFNQLAQSNFYDTFMSKVGGFRGGLQRLGIDQTVAQNIKAFAGNASQGLFNATRNVLTGIVSVVTVLAVSFYLSAEENGTKNFVKHLVPFKNQAYVTKLVTRIQRKVGSWVIGQLMLSLSIFILTYIGLLILHVDYALVLAIIAGLLEIVPYIGPIISVIPAAFFAFIQDPPLALAVLILYLVVQQLENHLLVPIIMSKSVGINPVLVILGVLIGGTLGGWIGAIIAIPLLSGLLVFFYDFFDDSDSVREMEQKMEA